MFTQLKYNRNLERVKDIHADFYHGAGWTVKICDELMNVPKSNELEYFMKLKDIGFVNCETVKIATHKTKQYSNIMATVKEVYSYKYLGYPIITKSLTEQIREYYGLSFRQVRDYKGGIPVKNAISIVNAKQIIPYFESENLYMIGSSDVFIKPQLSNYLKNDPIVLYELTRCFLIITMWIN